MKKILVTGMVILAIVVCLSVKSIAADLYGVSITADKLEVALGDTVKFTVTLKNITLSNGIGAISGELIYDSNIFETIEASDIVQKTGWDSIGYNENGGKFATVRSSGDTVKIDSPVMEITAKVKSDATTRKYKHTNKRYFCI